MLLKPLQNNAAAEKKNTTIDRHRFRGKCSQAAGLVANATQPLDMECETLIIS